MFFNGGNFKVQDFSCHSRTLKDLSEISRSGGGKLGGGVGHRFLRPLKRGGGGIKKIESAKEGGSQEIKPLLS